MDEKINQYTRITTVPLAAFQAFAMYTLLLNQRVVPQMAVPQLIALVITMTAGTMLAVWLGELISEYGVGNGISVLIFAGIVARLPVVFRQTISTIQPEDIARIAGFLAFTIVIIALIVLMNEATRQIPINYSRRAKNAVANSSYLPLRLNQAGVIPIIFAVSLVLLPQFLGQFLSASSNARLAEIGNFLVTVFNPQNIFYTGFYFLLVVGFTYFYTAVVFNPEKIAENLQKSGGYIPGIRPGKQTEKYLAKVLNRITLVGALFLGFIAVLPGLLQNIIGLSNLAVGGTGILIVVSVVLEVTRDLEAQLVMREGTTVLSGNYMNIILLGMPGSGKGTQAKLLVKKLGLYYFEGGDFSRELAEINTRIKTLMEKGELIPEEEMTKYVSEHLEENVKDYNNLLFDGYPRFVTQYQFLEKWLHAKGGQINRIIIIKVSEEEIIKRLSARRTCVKCDSVYNLITNPPPGDKCECGGGLVQRVDDKPEAIKERFRWFTDNTQPMIDYVTKVSADKIIEVNGERSINVIHEEILERLGVNAKN